MSAALQPQVIEPEEFIPLLDYKFLGDDVTVENKRKVIENLRLKAAVYVAAHAAGVSKKTVYRWRAIDSQFAEAWDEALVDAKEIMENSVYEDALNGNTLLKMFWLKRHDPAYRDKVTLDIQTVQDEIQERMKLAGLSEQALAGVLPTSEGMQIPPPLDDSQKED